MTLIMSQHQPDDVNPELAAPSRAPGALLHAILAAHVSPSTPSAPPPPPALIPKPTPAPNASQILPRLFLSDVFTALNPATLCALRITHIISVMEHVPKSLASQSEPASDSGSESEAPRTLVRTRLHIPIWDLPLVDIRSHFDTTRQFIDTALRDPDAHVLVHCFKGISRSPTIVAAYLIASLKMTTDDALSHIMSARPAVLPNRGFRRQLEQYEELLREEEDMVCSEK